LGSYIGSIIGAAVGVGATSMIDGHSTLHLAIGAAIGSAALYYIFGMLGIP